MGHLMHPTLVQDLAHTINRRLMTYFAPDEFAPEDAEAIQNHVTNSVDEAAFVQCVGMTQRMPLQDLYQPTKFKETPLKHGITIASILGWGQGAVIFAGPGQGKTTFLKHLIVSRTEDPRRIPLLLTLRTEGTVGFLSRLVDLLDERRQRHHVPQSGDSLLFLVDGYDEVTEADRSKVASTLKRILLNGYGMYILTCRSGYSVHGITADEYELSQFDRDDAIRFVDAFGMAMGLHVAGAALISELEQRKLTYITTHPLMLTLACVIKTRANPSLPHNAVELLRQVTETLGYRWDEGKGVSRASQMGLSAYNLLEAIMLIAHEMSGLKVPMADVVAIVRRYLVLIRRPDVDPERVVGEIRRFYGLLSTTADGQVQFVHKTIHDYYAARYAVENQLYHPTKVLNWDTRAAYSACMTHDATRSLTTALLYSRSMEAFRECLVNSARFDAEVVAAAIFEHFNKFHDYTMNVTTSAGGQLLGLSSESDFFDAADVPLLMAMIEKAQYVKRTTAVPVVVGFCLSECMRRNVSVVQLRATIEDVIGPRETELLVDRFGKRHQFSVAALP